MPSKVNLRMECVKIVSSNHFGQCSQVLDSGRDVF
jgi:hypothetical protein